MTTHLTGRFVDAVRYAADVHADQTRKGTNIPYVSHLIAVASFVLDDGGDEDEAIAALLHDAAEDHGGRARLEDIRARFGDKVAHIV
ncbi:MAG: HD domain-containing protein, partial [Acidobacteriota bacterium]